MIYGYPCYPFLVGPALDRWTRKLKGKPGENLGRKANALSRYPQRKVIAVAKFDRHDGPI
jgi:hypothetical protein